jgi:hypothetical protein
MKPRTLVMDRLYFGLAPLKLRAATGRALARVVGLPPERARVSATHLRQDFAVDTIRGQGLVDDFVAEGLLEPPTERQSGYGLTPEFLQLASARIVEPLARTRARQLIAEACAVAERFNDDAMHNPIAVTTVAVFGDYMSRASRLEQLGLGVVVSRRAPSRRTRFGRMLSKAEGANALRDELRAISSFVRVRLATELSTLPRPFAVVFQADGTRAAD